MPAYQCADRQQQTPVTGVTVIASGTHQNEDEENFMKAYTQYWTFSAIRGLLTLLAGIAIVAIPAAASSMLSIPTMATLAIDALAAYCLLDAGAAILLGILLPARATHRRALFVQPLVSIACGLTLFAVAWGSLGMGWAAILVAIQAGGAALAEFSVARDTHRDYGCLSCYTSPLVLGVLALMLPFSNGLSPEGMALAFGSFVGLYGISELFLGGRMLFLEYRVDHPAVAVSQDWKLTMGAAQPASVAGPIEQPAALTQRCCDECPADSICHGESLEAKLTCLANGYQPAIVIGTRSASLVRSGYSSAA